MALSSVTITYDIADLVGADFDPRRTKVWVTTNAESVIDTTGAQIRLDDGLGTLGADGKGSVSVWVPGAGSNPATWQTTVHIDYAPRRPNTLRVVKDFGPFTITAAGDLANLIQEQIAVPTASAATSAAAAAASATAAQAARTGAEAARDAAVNISQISTSDDVVEALVKGTAGAGPKTRAALGSAISDPTTDIGAAADDVAFINALIFGG